MTKDKKITKADALKMCEGCKKRNSKECVYSDVEGSREEEIAIPKCMYGFEHKVEQGREKVGTPTIESSNTDESSYTKNGNGNEKIQKVEQGYEKVRTAQGYYPKSSKIKLSKLDEEIIELLKDQYHLRGIAKELNHPPSTISYRLQRLKKAGLIQSYNGAYGTKLYKLSSNLNTPHDQTLVYDDNRQQSAHSFTAHSMTFKFPLISGIQPKSSHPFNMKNWTGYTFHYNDHEIRSTTKSIIIDINQDLGAGSIDDLNLKYAEIAQAHAQNFAKQHDLTLGTPQRYRKPHFTIPDTAIGQILSERGTFKTKGMDLSIDESKSKGDLEMGEESARAFEFTLNKLPDIANKIETKMGELNETTIDEFSKTTDRFDRVDEGITNLHVLIQMKHENDKLREDLKETLKLVQDQIGMQTPATETPTDDKINRNHIMQIYG